jgi:hypothetical protein
MLLGLLVIATFLVACRGEYQPTEVELEGLNALLPSFLWYVDPEPLEDVLLETFRTGEHHELRRNPEHFDADSSICAGIFPFETLEPGDFFEAYREHGEYFPDRVSAVVDGRKLEADEGTVIIVSGHERWVNGNLIAASPGAHIMCWPARIGIGEHVATVNVRKTSGAILSYSWSFELLNG